MFAIFLSDKMEPFYYTVSSFPTVIFTGLLIFCIFYWALAVLGLVEIEFLDFDIPDSDIDLDAGDSLDNLNVMSGLLLRLGLNGVPVTIVISLMSLIGWVISFFVVYYLFWLIPTSLLKFLVGIPVFFATLYASAMVTSVCIKPLRPIFQAMNQQVTKTLVGQVAVVRTLRVDQGFGEATVEDGGAGLIIKVRSYKEEVFSKGDRVVLLERVAEENLFKVISEEEFEKSE